MTLTRSCPKGLAGVALMLSTGAASLGQWSSDPGINNPVGTGASDQVDPRTAPGPNGGVWIGWFQSVAAPVHYELRAQLFDADGNEVLASGGVVASAQNNNTALFGWSMTSDANGNAILAFSDERNGTGLDLNVQKVTPAGALPWGPSGVSLSSNADFEPAPAVGVAGDGDAVVAWARDPSAGFGDLRVQRIGPDGTLRYSPGGIVVPNTGATNQPGFVRVVTGPGTDVIVVWLRNIQMFISPRHIWAQRLSAGGAAMWNGGSPVIVLAQSLPIGYFPEAISDGVGGAVIGWHRAAGARNVVGVQRVLLDGSLGFPGSPDGLDPSTDVTRNRYSPSISLNQGAGQITVFFDERNSSQSQRGVYAQRFDNTGARLWGSEGAVITPLSQDNATGRIRHRETSDNGAIVTWFQDVAFGSPSTLIKARRVDSTASTVWNADVCTVESGKDDPDLIPLTDNALVLAWTDGRSGSNDIFAQRLNGDGTLGPAPPPCLGDADGSGVVDFGDITEVLENWGATGAPFIPGDADGSGVVNFGDITNVLEHFGEVCP